MRNEAAHPDLASLLAHYDAMGGVLDYVLLDRPATSSAYERHRAAAVTGMAEIDRRLHQWAVRHASEVHPLEMFFRLRWDAAAVTGRQIAFPVFWGTDVGPRPSPDDPAWRPPSVDGYTTAFFHPPYRLRAAASEQAQVFAAINQWLLGSDPERAEIFAWSTDWSTYFNAGHEWWGAFYWTICPAGADYIIVVGASATD